MKRLTQDKFHDLACAHSALGEVDEALAHLDPPADTAAQDRKAAHFGTAMVAAMGCDWLSSDSVDRIALGRAVAEAARRELIIQRDALRATLAPYIDLDDEAPK